MSGERSVVTVLSVALVGLGAIGLNAHLPALLRSRDIEVVAVADPDPARREHGRTLVAHGTAVLDDLDAVLTRTDVEAVVLATPPWATTDLAVRAARSGRFVLAEKPVATSTAAAEPFDQLTATERSRVQVGLTYRHDPALAHLREVLAGDQLGGPLLVRAHIYDERRTDDDQHTGLLERTLAHGTPVIHEGAHVLDWLAFLLGGGPELEDAWSLATRPGLAQDNLTGARLRYPDGTQALLEFGWLTDVLPRCELTFLGQRGLATLDGHSFELEIAVGSGTPERVVFPGERGPRCFDLQVARLVELGDGRRTAADPSLDDGIAALALSEQIARTAMASDRTDDMEDVR